MRKLILCLLLAATCVIGEDGPVRIDVQTTAGTVFIDLPPFGGTNVKRFLGIPYAKPPVGDLRWKPPQKPDPWTTPRKCLSYSPACPQPTTPVYGDIGPTSEDCLYLNVFTSALVTPDNKEKRPVLFWIHGGGFTIGSASQSWYDGSHLARDGAVVVTFNYRLGVFGFLAHPALSAESPTHTSGNYGLMDMLLALNWVKDNIASFGGDPNNVTLWGESAGGAAVDALMCCKDAKGLFHRAISMSSNTIVDQRWLNRPDRELQSMDELGVEFQKRLQIGDGPEVLKELRAKTPAELIKAARPGSAVPGVSTTDNLIIDGVLLTEPLKSTFAGRRQANVPVLYGNVADEGSMFAPRAKLDTVAKYKEFLDKRYGPNAGQAFDIYPAADDAAVTPALALLFTDIFFATTRAHARQMSALQPSVFVYHFTRKAKPMLESKWDVYHGAELPFFFGTMSTEAPPKDSSPSKVLPGPYTPEEFDLSRLIRTYIIAFAKDGNPNAALAPRAPEWPAWTPKEEQHLTLDVPISVGAKAHGKTLDAGEKMK